MAVPSICEEAIVVGTTLLVNEGETKTLLLSADLTLFLELRYYLALIPFAKVTDLFGVSRIAVPAGETNFFLLFFCFTRFYFWVFSTDFTSLV